MSSLVFDMVKIDCNDDSLITLGCTHFNVSTRLDGFIDFHFKDLGAPVAIVKADKILAIRLFKDKKGIAHGYIS